MGYTALYRKFRPSTFDEVKGQHHIITTLKNQMNANRVGHAYLFCGTRGTGKTSVAKIFAQAVNCENPIDGSPCGQCEICSSIKNGSSMNVMEIDAASNNGVDSIRQIRDEVQYSPTDGKYKVYIIDEVHMLSIGAFNALLKTLEEPPSYVIFILATTEVHKIPVTILSRCQRYEFKRITVETISDRLQELVEIEGADVEQQAIRYIAKMADGAMRDALSLLDQCLAFYMNQKLTYDKVLEVLGTVDLEVFARLLQSIINQDVNSCISIVDEIVMLGRELGQFVLDFTWYLRNLMLVKSSDDVGDFIDVSSERLELMQNEASQIQDTDIMRYIRILSELSNQMKYSSSKRVLLEIAIIKMVKPQMEKDTKSLIARIEQLEKRIENGDVPARMNPNVANSQTETVEKQTIPTPKLDIAVSEDVQYVVDNWQKIQAKLGKPLDIYVSKAKFSVQGEKTLLIVFEDPTLYQKVNETNQVERIHDIVGNITGKDVDIKVKLLKLGEDFENHYIDINTKINFEIEEEDF